MTTNIRSPQSHGNQPGQPAASGNNGGGGAPASTRPSYSKRGKITIVACVPCRRRKTKCDGKRPRCSQCHARDDNCLYDMSEEHRRLTFLRENVEQLAEEKTSLEQILDCLTTSSSEKANEILHHLRSGVDHHALLQQLQGNRAAGGVAHRPHPQHPPMPGASGPTGHQPHGGAYEKLMHVMKHAASTDVDEVVRRIRLGEAIDAILDAVNSGTLMMSLTRRESDGNHSIESEYSTREQTFGLTRVGSSAMPGQEILPSRAPDAHTPPTPNQSVRWTSVTDDKDLIEHLLSTYFLWQHSFFQNFPEELFRQDMTAGRTKYCSRVLVNAICAAGALLSPRMEARTDPKDPQTAGAAFFDEGVRLLNKSDRPSIPTTAGVFLLSHVEGYRGRLGAMWQMVGRSGRMALNLNLHLRNDKTPLDNLSLEAKKEEVARVHAFWGCFISDQVTSFTLGRLPQFLTNAITVDLPPKDNEIDEQTWHSAEFPSGKHVPGLRATAFRECASLSKIVNSTLLMFFAPSQIMKGSLLLDEYQKYQAWYRRLPECAASTDRAPPHVLCLHMYYHAAVLLLFRPFLAAKFTESSLTPSEVCRQSADAISELFQKHRALYDITGIFTFQLQCLLAACTIHIINLPAISSTTALTNACMHFHDLVPRSGWAVGSLTVIKGLVQKWNIILPREVEAALYRPHAEYPNATSFFDDPAAPQAEIFRPQKRSAFLNPSSEVMQKRARLAPVVNSGGSSDGQAAPGGQANAASVAMAALNPGGIGGGVALGGPPRSGSVGTGVPVGGGEVNFGAAFGDGGSGSVAGSIGSQPTSSTMPTREQPSNYLFAPFPNQPAPLLGPIHTSTGSDTELNDELSKVAQVFDGLRFEGDGWYDPFMGWQGD